MYHGLFEKGRKPENIARREKKLQKNEEDLLLIAEQNTLIEKLDCMFQNNNAEYFVRKGGDKTTPYTYKLYPFIIFRDVDGSNWHFAGYKSKYNTPYGSLISGLPYGYQKNS